MHVECLSHFQTVQQSVGLKLGPKVLNLNLDRFKANFLQLGRPTVEM